MDSWNDAKNTFIYKTDKDSTKIRLSSPISQVNQDYKTSASWLGNRLKNKQNM